jgi:hypothetical protein
MIMEEKKNVSINNGVNGDCRQPQSLCKRDLLLVLTAALSSTCAAADALLAARVLPSSSLTGVSSCELSDSVRRARSRVSRRIGRNESML